MLKSNIKNTKCSSLDYIDEFRASKDVSNLYGYNFESEKEEIDEENFIKIHNKVNTSYFGYSPKK